MSSTFPKKQTFVQIAGLRSGRDGFEEEREFIDEFSSEETPPTKAGWDGAGFCPNCFPENGTGGSRPSVSDFPSQPSDFQSIQPTHYLKKKLVGSLLRRHRRLQAQGCPSEDLLNAMNDETCSIVNEIARTDRGSYAGQTTSFDAFLVLADCV